MAARLEIDADSWQEFGFIATFSHCWWCGRFAHEPPRGWSRPFLIERAHIVNSPRREDRRVAALLCSRCHAVQHGLKFDKSLMVESPTLAELIWLKKKHDPKYYDREFMQANCLTVLPRADRPRNVERLRQSARSGQSCEHIVVDQDNSAICSKCGKDFGWYCPISSKSFCEYTGDDECCVHCGEPEERQ